MTPLGDAMQTLHRKALRDLRLMWSQALTIALVVASGIGGFIGMLSAVESLAQARDDFYARGAFADIFASVRRAPESLGPRLAEVPGVIDVQLTVEAAARLTVPHSTDPVIGQLIGLDAGRLQRLNRVSLRMGRWPQTGAGNALEVVLNEGFAAAHDLQLGDPLFALVNGKRRPLRVTGIALSPEYIFGGLFGVPDRRAFGVVWLDKNELAAATDMTGAFNRVAIKLSPQASHQTVIDAVTRTLAPYGGTPAYSREEQASHAMLTNEITEQRVMGTVLPAIFLAVAGFLLHMVTARLVATQREQVATLKALGYADSAIAAHYLALVAPMALGGYGIGVALGAWMGRGLTALYTDFFRFPSFVYSLSPGLALLALLLVMLTATAGTLTAIAATVQLSPAQAMQPPSPGRYRPALVERLPGLRLSPALRMILRNMTRRPLRTLMTLAGIASAVAIVIMGNFFRDAVATIVDTQFNLAMRSDITVWTTDPVTVGAARSLARMPGVLQVEPSRRVAVRFVHGARSEKGSIDGRPADALLQRLIDANTRQVHMGTHGLVMTDRLARKLNLQPGDQVTLEVREGRRIVRQVVIEATVRDMFGLNAYMERGALNRLLGEGDVATSFALRVQGGQVDPVLEATQDFPRVAGVFSKSTLLANMQTITARNILIMSSILTAFAGVIAVGVVYNNACIALSERGWELASLRVLGFSRGQVSLLLLGELGVSIAIALPLGMVAGWGLTHVIVTLIQSDQLLFPVVIQPRTYAWAALAVVMAGLASALVVRRQIDHLDMVAVLKTRE